MVDEIVILQYVPRSPEQVPAAGQGRTTVGQAFEIEAYNLDQLLEDYRFTGPLEVFIPFTQELLDQVDGDPSQLTLHFYDEVTGRWAAIPTTVIRDGLYARVEHLTLFSLLAPVQSVGTLVVPPDVPLEVSLFLSSLYDESVPLHVGDTAHATLFVDSGGLRIVQVVATIIYPQELIEVIDVDISRSVCNRWPSDPLVEPGLIRLNCGITGTGYSGGSIPVIDIAVRSINRGIAGLTISSDSQVNAVDDFFNLLGYRSGVTLYIDEEIPAAQYPSAVVPQNLPRDLSGLIAAIVSLTVLAGGAAAAALAVVLLRRQRAVRAAATTEADEEEQPPDSLT